MAERDGHVSREGDDVAEDDRRNSTAGEASGLQSPQLLQAQVSGLEISNCCRFQEENSSRGLKTLICFEQRRRKRKGIEQRALTRSPEPLLSAKGDEQRILAIHVATSKKVGQRRYGFEGESIVVEPSFCYEPNAGRPRCGAVESRLSQQNHPDGSTHSGPSLFCPNIGLPGDRLGFLSDPKEFTQSKPSPWSEFQAKPKSVDAFSISAGDIGPSM